MKTLRPTAPVLFLIFNRPDVTRQVFAAISRARPSYLFIAADGPRPNRPDDIENCNAARAVVERIDWPCEVKTLFRNENLSCRAAVSTAIDWFFAHVEEGIILEDDCLPADSFFPFCAELLERFRADRRVMMISGTNLQNGIRRGTGSYYFSRIFRIWGWATWRRAWALNDQSMGGFSCDPRDNILNRLFVDRNIALSWIHAFAQVKTGHVNTWDYPWVYSCFMQNGLSITPNVNLVTNIGFGAESTHTSDPLSALANMPRHDIDGMIHNDQVFCDQAADAYEYEQARVFPFKESMGLAYLYKRYRRARRLGMKIDRLRGSFGI